MTLLLLLAFLLFVNTNSLLSLRTDHIINTISSQKSQIYDSQNSIIKTETKKWGAFDIEKIKHIQNEKQVKQVFQTVFLSTARINSSDLDQLYLPSYNEGRLQITGQASLQGDLSVPNNDIRTTSAAGFIYTGSMNLNGRIKSSLSTLPEIENIDYNDYLDFEKDSIIAFEKSKTAYQSFKKSGVTIINDQAVFLNNHDYKGFIKIVSNREIIVNENAILEDIELVAPVITFKSGFTGKVHAVARDSIIIRENVILNFPSSLTIAHSDFDNNPTIVIQKKSTVEGLIRQFKKVPETDTYPQLLINKDATFRGSIYNTANTELRGTIDGSIYTKSFIAYIDGRIYRNYIFDGKILKSEWFEAFERSLTLPSGDSNFPLKWLY